MLRTVAKLFLHSSNRGIKSGSTPPFADPTRDVATGNDVHDQLDVQAEIGHLGIADVEGRTQPDLCHVVPPKRRSFQAT